MGSRKGTEVGRQCHGYKKPRGSGCPPCLRNQPGSQKQRVGGGQKAGLVGWAGTCRRHAWGGIAGGGGATTCTAALWHGGRCLSLRNAPVQTPPGAILSWMRAGMWPGLCPWCDWGNPGGGAQEGGPQGGFCEWGWSLGSPLDEGSPYRDGDLGALQGDGLLHQQLDALHHVAQGGHQQLLVIRQGRAVVAIGDAHGDVLLCGGEGSETPASSSKARGGGCPLALAPCSPRAGS